MIRPLVCVASAALALSCAGGSHGTPAAELPSAYRTNTSEDTAARTVGIRCCKTP